ncbi:MAG TPA: hypothetical protein ENJ95_17525 [Bacteroidetes bacterium]|nr:hypothetical protein [Bacteroidota bacterium]
MREAIECLEESAFTPEQLNAYDKYWDGISSEKTLLADAKEKGMQLTLQVIRMFNGGNSAQMIGEAKGLNEAAVLKVLRDAGLDR